MSKGLGAVERYVLDHLPSYGISGLADQMSHDRWLAENGLECQYTRDCCDFGPYAVSPGMAWKSEYESVRRAVHSLQRKGLVYGEWQVDQEMGERPRPYLVVRKR